MDPEDVCPQCGDEHHERQRDGSASSISRPLTEWDGRGRSITSDGTGALLCHPAAGVDRPEWTCAYHDYTTTPGSDRHGRLTKVCSDAGVIG
jgi:hypothetical protein